MCECRVCGTALTASIMLSTHSRLAMRLPLQAFLHTSPMPPAWLAPTTMTASWPANITTVWKTSVQITAFRPPWDTQADAFYWPKTAHRSSSLGHKHSGTYQSGVQRAHQSHGQHCPPQVKACHCTYKTPQSLSNYPVSIIHHPVINPAVCERWRDIVNTLTCIQSQGWSVQDHPHINDLQRER